MKLEGLLKRLELIRLEAEATEFDRASDKHEYFSILILDLLLDYIGNEKVKEKVNEIPF